MASEHTYRRVDGISDAWLAPDMIGLTGEVIYEERVKPGWPHGDAWGRVINPDAPPTHDTERHAAILRNRARSATMDKRGKK